MSVVLLIRKNLIISNQMSTADRPMILHTRRNQGDKLFLVSMLALSAVRSCIEYMKQKHGNRTVYCK